MASSDVDMMDDTPVSPLLTGYNFPYPVECPESVQMFTLCPTAKGGRGGGVSGAPPVPCVVHVDIILVLVLTC